MDNAGSRQFSAKGSSMRRGARSLVGVGTLTLALTACSQGPDGSHEQDGDFSADEAVGSIEVNPDAAVQGQPEAEITINGRKLQLVGPITKPFPARATDAQFKESSGSRPLSTYTLDELALGMRPVVIRDGYFYSTDEPDYELATKGFGIAGKHLCKRTQQRGRPG